MDLPFGQWAPDLPAMISDGTLTRALNLRPQVGGYAPMQALVALPNSTATAARPRGSLSGIDHSGAGYLYAGTETTLEVQGDSGMNDVSRASGYALAPTDRWSFTQFGNFVFAATASAALQYHQIGSVQPFQDVPRFAPNARHVAAVGNHIICGNLFDREGGPLPDAIRWPGVNNPLVWPAFGSDASVSVQADRQTLEGNGGWVQDVVSAAEVGVVFQEKQLHRMEYVGGREIFTIKRLCQGNGMMIPASGVAFNRMVFYIAEDGFRIFDMTGSQPIGKDRVNETFLADLDSAYFDRVETAKDPSRTHIWTIYPGAGNTSGRPNKGIMWDYVLDRFTQFELDLEGLIQNATETALSIDAPASAGDPDDVDDPSGEFSFDDRTNQFGSSSMGAFDTSFIAGSFTGEDLAGEIETGDLQLNPGGRGFISGVRALVDGRAAEVSVGGKGRREDDIVFGQYVLPAQDGLCPFRSDERYHRIRLKLRVGWTDAVGLDIEGGVAGGR